MTKTAYALTREEWKQYHPRTQNLPLPNPDRLNSAWKVVRDISLKLRQKFAIKRIIVFGSLARQFDFHDDSDIDLAIELEDQRFFYRAASLADRQSGEFKVDIIDVGQCTDSIKEKIKKEGIVL